MKKFVGFVFLILKLSCSFINNRLQVVCVFFHHGKHVIYDTNGPGRKKANLNIKKGKEARRKMSNTLAQ